MAKAYLDNVTVEDDFTDAATCIFQHTSFRVSLIIGTASVDVEYWVVPDGMRAEAGSWRGVTEFRIPGAGTVTRPFLIGGCRFKNHIPGGAKAQVTATIG